MKARILIVIVAIFASGGCKHIAFRKYIQKYSLSFGHSGGFTGATNEHILTGRGSLYHIKEFSKDTSLLKTIGKKELKHIFKMADSKALKKLELNNPGNLTQFIRFYRNGQLVNSWQWAEGSEPPVEIRELHASLHKLY